MQRSKTCLLSLALICFVIGTALPAVAQRTFFIASDLPLIRDDIVTNAIPPNLFLTDDGKIFRYKLSEGKDTRVVLVSKIAEAEKSPESRPADQDPEGHWGVAKNGFQLSLRLRQSTYTNGESMPVVIFMRNVTNQTVKLYSFPTVEVSKDNKALEKKARPKAINGFVDSTVSVGPGITQYPQTQHKYFQYLEKIYDLNEPGDYVVKAKCQHPEVSSQEVYFRIVK